MKRMLSFLWLAGLIILSTVLFAQDNKNVTASQYGMLIVTINGFEHTDGQARVYLFRSKDGFPSKPDKALVYRKEQIPGPELQIRFVNLPYGDYAVAVHHDENGNDKLDANWMHIPKEPTGATNGARGRFGPPKFDKAKFALDADTVQVTVTLK